MIIIVKILTNQKYLVKLQIFLIFSIFTIIIKVFKQIFYWISNSECLFEIRLLRHHYHLVLAKTATNIAAGVPLMDAGILEPVLAKM